jgi:hypothetical protein
LTLQAWVDENGISVGTAGADTDADTDMVDW